MLQHLNGRDRTTLAFTLATLLGIAGLGLSLKAGSPALLLVSAAATVIGTLGAGITLVIDSVIPTSDAANFTEKELARQLLVTRHKLAIMLNERPIPTADFKAGADWLDQLVAEEAARERRRIVVKHAQSSVRSAPQP